LEDFVSRFGGSTGFAVAAEPDEAAPAMAFRTSILVRIGFFFDSAQ
jgi:hypothetical protein